MNTEVKIETPNGEITIHGPFDSVSRLIALIKNSQIFVEDKAVTSIKSESKENKSQTIYYCSGRGANAQAYLDGKNFRVLKGSVFCYELTDWAKKSDLALTRKMLIDKGFLKEQGGKWVLVKDYDFSSPSNAASNVLGRSANGNSEWTDADGKPFKKWIPNE